MSTVRTTIELLRCIEQAAEQANEAEPTPLRLHAVGNFLGRVTALSSRVRGYRIGPIKLLDLKRRILACF